MKAKYSAMPGSSYRRLASVLEAMNQSENEDAVPPSPCPHCHKVMDAATHEDRVVRPKPGDISICIYCAGVAQFSPELALVAFSEDEMRHLPGATRADIREAQATIRSMYLKPKRGVQA